MTQEYNIILRIARWLIRFRKRKGYGVHSPFAFDFITGVIYNSDTYYAYSSLRQPLTASIARLDEYDPESGLTAKDLRLLFRITNWATPSHIVLCGASQAIEAYIAAARPSATLTHIEAATHGRDHIHAETTPPLSTDTTPLIYCDHPSLIAEAIHTDTPTWQHALILVRGIHTDASCRRLWDELRDSNRCTVSFDLGRFGVVVTHPKINKQHYIVNYF